MIKGIGIDLVSIRRIERVIQRWGLKFVLKVFTPTEIEYCEARKEGTSICCPFCCQGGCGEDVGPGQGIGWKDIEVRNDKNGKPGLLLHGKARLLAEEMGIKKIHLDISHEKDMAVAQLIGEGD